MDVAERQARRAYAEELLPGLAQRGIGMVATTFVDNAGITRVKSVPLDRLPQLAAWGVGASTSFDYFCFDDWLAAPPGGTAPVGDLRVVPDLRRLVPLAAQPGWAWAPADRYRQDGEPHECCNRLLLQRLVDGAAGEGFEIKAGVEIEWVISAGDGEDFVSAAAGPGYGMSRLVALSDYAREVIDALSSEGVRVDQFHPEYAVGQLELSVAAESPVDAADTTVLVRSTIRAVGQRHQVRTSFSPKVESEGVGNGGHVHLSVWSEGRNLMAGGNGPCGLTPDGEAFGAGISEPTARPVGDRGTIGRVVSAAGALALGRCVRVLGPGESRGRTADDHRVGGQQRLGGQSGDQVLRPDRQSLPTAGWLLAAGFDGVAARATLPEPVDVDPAALPPDELDRRGIRRLPTSLGESTDALAADSVLRAALGSDLIDSVIAVRRSEVERFDEASAEEIVRAQRWTH